MGRPRIRPAHGRFHETFEQKYIRCGKAGCRCMNGGAPHGPYWYAFWTDERGRTHARYVGKNRDAGARSQQQRQRAAGQQSPPPPPPGDQQRRRAEEQARERSQRPPPPPPRSPRQVQDELDAALFGVSVDVTQAELKRAYRRAALEAHPDRGGSHQRMVDVNTAYERMAKRRGWF